MVFCMFTRPDNQSVYRYSHPSTVKLFWLVVEPPTPLKNMSSSNGIIVPNIYIYGKIKNVPNQQPVLMGLEWLRMCQKEIPKYSKCTPLEISGKQ